VGTSGGGSTLNINSGTSNYSAKIQDSVGGGTQTVAIHVNGGNLLISGNNTYTGGTNLENGTIKVGSNTALGAGQLNIQNSSLLDLNGKNLVTGAANGS